ncbi:ketoacyl-synt-domain-containing protein [Hypoxylon sp. FL1284]|nr:ketoacyl-synt-domain-containing protein [Hypoxylon sp. FL1284]
MAHELPAHELIAVVGSGCRFAGGATSPSKLWDVLCKAPDLSQEIPSARFAAKAFYHPDGEYHGTTNSIKAYWLEQDHRVFDAAMFNMNPVEAEATDPQQRLLLEVVYEAMESAGYTLNTYNGGKVGVFAGVMTADYDTLSQRDDLSTSQYFATGNARSIIANRISYYFNFQGPSMTIDTACSSSLVALHQAVLSLRSKESTMACVTGANLMITPEQFIVESSLHMLSPSGKSRMWDASADGYARGEGVAALLLKPLSRALADGDQIKAVIRETGTNSDGRTTGITLPNPKAQAELVRDTYRRAGLDALVPEHQCQYFEAHGTGTPAGDPREAEAIFSAFFGDVNDTPSVTDAAVSVDKSLLVGSIKTVLGHTEGAAGLAGVLKVIEAMKHDTVPPNLHLDSINPSVKPFSKHLKVPTSLVPWPTPAFGQPKRASVNSFGFGGSNAHAIIEAYDPQIHLSTDRLRRIAEKSRKIVWANLATQHARLPLPVFLSAGSQKSLRAVAASYVDYLLQHPKVDHNHLSWAVFSRRTALPYRLAISATSRTQLLEAMGKVASDESSSANLGIRSQKTATGPKILGVFTGQGAQWATMSKSLFRVNYVYRATLQELDDVLRSCPDPPHWTLREQIHAEADDSLVNNAAVSQPLCTAIQIGLVNLMTSLGLRFHAVVGHSSGEIAAAYAAGRLSAKDAMLVSYYRGFVAHLAGGPDRQKGGMLAVGISEQEAVEFCSRLKFSGRIHVAASNAPESVTLSGDLDAIHMAHDEFTKSKKFSRVLRVDSAYHSPHMAKPAVAYSDALRRVEFKPKAQGNGFFWVSSVHGRSMSEEEDLGSGYWKDNMVNMVRFHEAVENTISTYGPFDCALEVGPHAALKGPFQQTVKPLGHTIPYSSALDRSKDDSLAFSDLIGFLWSHFGLQGADFRQYIEQSKNVFILDDRLPDLPSYPWDHSEVHYRESRISRNYHSKSNAPHELLGSRTRDDNDHELRWRNILRLSKLPWIKHHRFQGQPLLPISAYCIMALDAAHSLLDGRSASLIELHNLQIQGGINVDGEFAGVEVLFTLAIQKRSEATIEAGITLTSCPADGTTTMKLNMTGTIKIHLSEPSLDALPDRCASQSECFSASPESFYGMMERTGLAYTGPFRALTSIQRRYNYSSGTVKRRHAEDTTTLRISPATLDTCFQSAFPTYSYPGDNALWHGFLPIRINQISFNLATYGRLIAANDDDVLTVDTQMVDVIPSMPDSKATFVVDMGIFNADGHREIQVEGLTIEAIAQTQPKDDYELYLRTIMDVDPSHEIVQGVTDYANHTFDPVLVEPFARVAQFIQRHYHYPLQRWLHKTADSRLSREFTSILEATKNDSWLSDTEEVISELINSWDPRDRLFGTLADPFTSIWIREHAIHVHHRSCFTKHVGRVAKQIVHRYPRMNILGLAGHSIDFLTDVLAAIGSSFSSFTIGAGKVDKHDRMLEPTSKKIISSPLDLSGDIGAQLGTDTTYDLVLLGAAYDSNSTRRVLESVRGVMTQGGFLVLVQQTQRLRKEKDIRASLSTPPEWPDYLDGCGFIPVANNCNQKYYGDFVISVCQLRTRELELIKQPSQMKESIANHLLIIGRTIDDEFVPNLEKRLSSLCERISSRDSLDNADSHMLSSCDAAIFLSDLDQPVTATMTQDDLDRLRDLLRPKMKVMWLTCDAISGNPYHAATFGFTRTVSSEVPELVLQMLDLEQIEGSADLVADAFIRLMVTSAGHSDFLWSDEREIHIRKRKRLVPRVLPLKASNDRVNSMRRVITEPANTARESVEVVRRRIPGGSVRYETRAERPSTSGTETDEVRIRVNYSSVEPVQIGRQTSAYVCLGYDTSTNKPAIALSQTNASYVSVPKALALSPESIEKSGLFLASVATRCLAASAISFLAGDRRIVLIDSDPELARCVAEIVGGRLTCYSTTITTSASQDTPYLQYFLHPKASVQNIKGIFPRSAGIIVDLQPESHKSLSERIASLLPAKCEYHARTSLFGNGQQTETSVQLDSVVNIVFWKSAAMRAGARVSSRIPIPAGLHDAISLPEVLSITDAASTSLFQMIDWRAERAVELIKPAATAEQLFRADRTYLLVGLTRDLGQSLCYMLVEHGARNIVLASRSPNMEPKWITELEEESGARIEVRKCDVTDFDSVMDLRDELCASMPPVAGVANGAMVLDDRVFAQMDIDTWNRVLRPKTIGSSYLDAVFAEDDLEFFIMTSSFAAIGGHPGQSNYAAANMYMNGLAADRRRRGLAGSVLNIGVIHGLGLLRRERKQLYAGLGREGYPPISERDIHHMCLEAVVVGRPSENDDPDATIDLTTGLRRFDAADLNHLHWHLDPRFGHYSRPDSSGDVAAAVSARQSLADSIAKLTDKTGIADAIRIALTERLETILQLHKGTVDPAQSMSELGVDSLAAVEARKWIFQSVGKDVSIIKLLGGVSLQKLCGELARQVLADRVKGDSGATDTAQ